MDLIVNGFEIKDVKKQAADRDMANEDNASSPASEMKEEREKAYVGSPMRKNVHTWNEEEEGDYVLKSPTKITFGGEEGRPVRVNSGRVEEDTSRPPSLPRKFSSRRPPSVNTKQWD